MGSAPPPTAPWPRRPGSQAARRGYFFGTIDELLREALLLFTREEVARLHQLAEIVGALGDPPLEEVARLFAQALADTHVGQRTLVLAQFELYLESARRPELAAAAVECIDAYRGLARAALEAIGSPRAEEVAGLFVALCDGLGLHQLADGREDYAGEVLEPALLDLLRAVR